MGRRGVEGDGPRGGRASAAIVVVAVLASVVGVVLAVDGMVGRPHVVTREGRAGDLRLEVSKAAWVSHDMEPMPGMSMAGMPADGYRRLHLEVAMRNEGGTAQRFAPDQFRLEAERQGWNLATTSFVTGALGPGQTMAGDLFFDLPSDATDRPLRLGWRPPGHDLQFRLDAALGDAPHADDDGHDE